MKTWNQLFIRHGWILEEKAEGTFNCKGETKENLSFLYECLDKAEISYTVFDESLEIHDIPIGESDWINYVSFEFRGRTENIGLAPDMNGPDLKQLDTYISGIVRQFNRLGFNTMDSCDGHGRRSASIGITKHIKKNTLVEMLSALGVKRVYCRESTHKYRISLPLSREKLLDLAENMSLIERSWLDKGYEYIKEQMFYHLLEELLSIPGESGNEQEIREYVKKRLTPFVDHIAIDRSGNLLAEKKYRTGNGPTILLNAHLDVVYELEENRIIEKKNGIWRSSTGILGADDRAGVAVILQMAEDLAHSSFNGKVKYIFTVQEECGLIGSSNVDDYFLWGIDGAFVVDRRGTGDIVVSCGSYRPFCDPVFGEFIEKVATVANVGEWKCTDGGSSDTRIWAAHGIQSVNLSAGYTNEHTDGESLDVSACYHVTKLLHAILAEGRELRRISQRIQVRNRIMPDLEAVQ